MGFPFGSEDVPPEEVPTTDREIYHARTQAFVPACAACVTKQRYRTLASPPQVTQTARKRLHVILVASLRELNI